MAASLLRTVARKTHVKDTLGGIMSRLLGDRWKESHELKYWRERKAAEGTLSNAHYKYFYTEHFALSDAFYEGKKVLDIGCGPRGSLEWATMTAKRVGVDPLADRYRELGTDKHAMEYVAVPSEAIPFPDAQFDVVCTFNSLDHVADVDLTIQEIKRLTRPGGLCLLMVEVNHPATAWEPHTLSPTIVDHFAPEFQCLGMDVYKATEEGLYKSIEKGEKLPDPRNTAEIGWLSARFRKS